MYVFTLSNLFAEYAGTPMQTYVIKNFHFRIGYTVLFKFWINLNVHNRDIVK